MNNYDEVTYKLSVPEGLTNGQSIFGTDSNFGKTSAVVEVSEYTGTTTIHIVSLHDRTDLAGKKAVKLAREASKVKGDNLVDYIVVDAVALPRAKTYFGENGEYGNADNVTTFDTSDWTEPMWIGIRYTYGKTVLAKHFYNKDHNFVDAVYHSSPTSGPIATTRCEECYLRPDQLNL